jgi:hypothetical protein
MLFDLKPLSREAIPAALAQAEHYRLLNEPLQAESICRDILAVDPANSDALLTLLLALTEQFERGIAMQEPVELAGRLGGAYEKAYFLGLIHERRALALFRQNDFHSAQAVYSLILQAMREYEQAQALRPAGNDDAVLRWNTCVRFLRRTPQLAPEKPVVEPATVVCSE